MRLPSWQRAVGSGVLPLAVALAAVLAATVAGSWVRAARPDDRLRDPSDTLRLVEWRGGLASDGTLAVEVRFVFRRSSDQIAGDGIPLTLALVEGATRLRINGAPVVVPGGGAQTGPLPPGDELEIAYEVPGAAQRIGDEVLVEAPVAPALVQATSNFGYAEVRGLLTLDAPGAPDAAGDADLRLPGLRQATSDRNGTSVAFVGVASTYDEVAMTALVDATAAPDAPAARGDGSAGARERFEEAAGARSEGRIPDGEPAPWGRTALLVAILATIELALLGAWCVWRWRVHRERQRQAGSLDVGSRREPPDGLDADVVAMIAAGTAGTWVAREAIAADVLSLAQRRVIRIESLTSRRFLLRIPANTTGASAAEDAILEALRPQGQSGVKVELLGPPLWGGGPHRWLRSVERDVRGRARAAGLLARSLSPWILAPAALVVPLTALYGSNGDVRVGAAGGVAIAVTLVLVAALSIAAPLSLTDRGLRARAEALAFARHAGTNEMFTELGAPAVITRGPDFVYATAVGCCPVAAGDVGVARQRPGAPS